MNKMPWHDLIKAARYLVNLFRAHVVLRILIMDLGAPYASALCNIDLILNQEPHIDALRNNYTTRTHMDFGSIHPLPFLNLYLCTLT